MKRFFLQIIAVAIAMQSYGFEYQQAARPDSAYIFAYATTKNNNKNGLHIAWSNNKEQWFEIGPEFSFVKSDYGNWGSEKRMIDPVLIRDNKGLWHAVWSLNNIDRALAHAVSKDLVNWQPQSYPVLANEGNCLKPEVEYKNGLFNIYWASTKGSDTNWSMTTTSDFKSYAPAKSVKLELKSIRKSVIISGQVQIGTIHKVSWGEIDNLIVKHNLTNYRNTLFAETTKDDQARFARLGEVKATVTINAKNTKSISDKLIGIFFEDINYAADGGIYAELVQNRGFEYKPSDRGNDRSWNSRKAWKSVGENVVFTTDSLNPLHENTPNYAVLDVKTKGAGLQNEGFDGIVLKAGDNYEFSVFAKLIEAKSAKLMVRLVNDKDEICGQGITGKLTNNWKKLTLTIKATKDCSNAKLELIPDAGGKYAFDMVSLFPQKTFMGRKNGLRADLAQVLADMKPRFIRFPGGCVAHGDGLHNIYNWKNTVGPLESRKPMRNIWNYHQTGGLGYFEYFQYCEDIGAAPLPVVAAGVPCQNSGKHECAIGGQQGGIPMDHMDEYIQDIFDLIEWANGDPRKNKWAKMRADAGHPKPFNLKYLGIGNEDLISDVFEERFEMIFKAVKEKYPEITIIGTVGPFSEGSDYDRGWEFATEQKVEMVDEHYYQPPGWFIHNQDYYDKYDRNKSKVYLGEYASHLPGRPVNIETALTEALHLINVERNGDVVAMTSYAPLLAKEGHTQWNPDLIYFNNSEVKPTVGYQVQKLFGNNSGTKYIGNQVVLSDNRDAVTKRIACSVVKDEATNDYIVKLVNLLPVSTDLKLDLGDITPIADKASKTVLSGTPDDKNAMPVTEAINAGKIMNLTLKPYSLTIIRIK